MNETRVWVFFYGSYMNMDVLRDVGVVPAQWEPARLPGFDITVRPRANLEHSPRHCVYGVVATATHRELDKLYEHARDVLGETYLPEPVLTETLDGKWRPALCYIAPDMTAGPASGDYLDRIIAPARALRFPGWYLERLESFRR